jgi:RimJ/RimL family protein N-acetyltransferase
VIVKAAPLEHVLWLAERAQFTPSMEIKAIEAVDDTGRIHGMAGFDGWTANSVVLTLALDNPAAFRQLVFAIFHYAFIQAGRGVALATVRGSNARSLKLCRHVGMREAYRVRDGVAVGEDLVIMEMRREECRWIPHADRKAA